MIKHVILYILASIAMLIGLALLVITIVHWVDTSSFIERGITTTGTVFKIERHLERDGDTSNGLHPSYYPIVQYETIGGQTFLFKSDRAKSNTAPYRVGEEVEILYDPASPSRAEIKSFVSLDYSFIRVGAIAGFLLFSTPIGIILYRRMRKRPYTVGVGKYNIYVRAFLSLLYFPTLPILVFTLGPWKSDQLTPRMRFNILRDLFTKRTKTVGHVRRKRIKEPMQLFSEAGGHDITRFYIKVEQLEFNVPEEIYNWLNHGDKVVVDHWPHSRTVAMVEKV